MSKETLSDVIDFIKKAKKLNQGEISLHAGYKKETLAQIKGNPDKHPAAIRQLKIAFKEVFTNSINDIDKPQVKKMTTDTVPDTYLHKYIAVLEENNQILKEKNKRLEDKLDKVIVNLETVLENQLILATFSNAHQDVLLRLLAKGEKEYLALQSNVGKKAEQDLKAVAETDNHFSLDILRKER